MQPANEEAGRSERGWREEVEGVKEGEKREKEDPVLRLRKIKKISFGKEKKVSTFAVPKRTGKKSGAISGLKD